MERIIKILALLYEKACYCSKQDPKEDQTEEERIQEEQNWEDYLAFCIEQEHCNHE